MAEQFESRDLTDVDIDAAIDRLVINGVDATQFVNEGDEWFPRRSQVRATEHLRYATRDLDRLG